MTLAGARSSTTGAGARSSTPGSRPPRRPPGLSSLVEVRGPPGPSHETTARGCGPGLVTLAGARSSTTGVAAASSTTGAVVVGRGARAARPEPRDHHPWVRAGSRDARWRSLLDHRGCRPPTRPPGVAAASSTTGVCRRGSRCEGRQARATRPPPWVRARSRDARWRSLLDHRRRWRSLLDHRRRWRSLLDHRRRCARFSTTGALRSVLDDRRRCARSSTSGVVAVWTTAGAFVRRGRRRRRGRAARGASSRPGRRSRR